jgi:hypothetical protein
MSYRRRHRWFRRMSLGLALATVFVANVSVASAKFGGGTNARIELQSPAVQGEDAKTKAAAQGSISVSTGATRPDDRADRFSHVEVASAPQPADDRWTVAWDDAALAAVGGLVLVLGLGLALGYLRRPRLAGL